MRKNHTFLLCTFLVLCILFFILVCDNIGMVASFFYTQRMGVLFDQYSIPRLAFSFIMFWVLLFALLPLATSFIFILISHINKGSIIGAFLFILLSFFSLLGAAGLMWGAMVINRVIYLIKILSSGFNVSLLIQQVSGIVFSGFVIGLPAIATLTLILSFVFGTSRMPDKYYK